MIDLEPPTVATQEVAPGVVRPVLTGKGIRALIPTEPPAHESPMPGQCLAVVDFASDYSAQPTVTRDIDEANLIISRMEHQDDPLVETHRPVLDIDLPVRVLESSTPGHSHVYIDYEMSWEAYEKLLWALADAGLIEAGYVRASVDRGYTALRLPWVRK